VFSFPLVSPPNSLCTSFLPHIFHLPHPSHSSSFDHPHNFFLGVLIMGLLITQSSPIPCYQISLRLQYLSQHPLLEHIQPIYHWFTKPKLTLWLAILAVLDVTYLCSSSSEQRTLADDKATVFARYVNTCPPKYLLPEFHIYSRRNPKLTWMSLWQCHS